MSESLNDPRNISAKNINYAIDIFLWATGIALLSWFVIRGEYSLIFSTAKYAVNTFLWLMGLSIFLKKWSLKTIISDIHFSVAFPLSYATSALISGDWNVGEQLLSSLTFGSFHTHHSDWGGLISAMLFPVAVAAFAWRNPEPKAEFYKKYSLIPLVAGLVIAIFFVAAIIEKNFLSSSLSFRIVSGVLSFVCLGVGLWLRSPAVKAKGFKRVAMSLFGIALAIFLEGMFGVPSSARNF